MITIYDIAARTGYSAPTISKALNGTGGLSDATRKKIIDVAKELGYKPNMTARSLVTKKSHLVGIIFEDEFMERGFEHPLFGGVLNFFRSEMEKAGYDLIFLSGTSSVAAETYLDHCLYRNVDAVIVINPCNRYDEIVEIARAGIPCVSVNDIIPEIPFVISANEEAGAKAAEYLVACGHTKLGCIVASSTEYSRAAAERLSGFKKALEQRNVGFDDSQCAFCKSWFKQDAYGAMKLLMEAHPETTAVFVSNDNMTLGAIECCDELGLSVPSDVSFVGFDDEIAAAHLRPSLTTFKQNREEIAKTAARILLDSLAKKGARQAGGTASAESVRIPTDFVERNSVAKLN